MKTSIIATLFLILTSNVLLAQQAPQAEKKQDKHGIERYYDGPKIQKAWTYAQAVKVGNMLYISGTAAPGKDLNEQLKHVYARIKHTLKAYQLDQSHVVKETVYTRDIDAMSLAQPIRAEFYGEHHPASTWVQIDRLLEEGAWVEIEIVAFIPD